MYQVIPDYCIGDNTPFEMSPEDLAALLFEELAHQYHEEIGDTIEPLDIYLTLGHRETDGTVTFDVTRQGARQSTLRIRQLD